MNKRDMSAVTTVDAQRGVLHPRAGTTRFVESIRQPAADLDHLIRQYWSVQWDLRECAPYPVELVPRPSVNLVVGAQRAWIQGVVRGRFTYVLEDVGRLFGVAFQPAGFRPFIGSPVSELTGRTPAVAELFGPEGAALVERIGQQADDAARVDLVEAFVRARLPALDPNVRTINALVDDIMSTTGIRRVADIAALSGLGKRTLQRLFSDYVGVNPKWIIQRYRLQEAAAQLDCGDWVDLAELALDLGYADQAHFARDFKAVVGTSPSAYRVADHVA